MPDPTPPGVPDGEEVAREAILEVQLAFAGTLVATGTACAWYALDAVRTAGLQSVPGLIACLAAVGVLQLYVFDHTWFLVLRGAWLASVLVARQDARNLRDATYVAQLEALYDAGSVRFQRGLGNVLESGLALGLGIGGWLLVTGSTGGRVVGLPLALACGVALGDRLVLGRLRPWRDRVRPRLGAVSRALGVHWVDPPYGTVHRVRWAERALRGVAGLILLILNLTWVLVSALAPEQEVVHRAEGADVVLRFHLGGLRPSEDSVEVILASDTVDQALLDQGTTWMGDGMLVVLPTAALADGRHEVTAEVQIHQAHASLSIGMVEPAVFVVLP